MIIKRLATGIKNQDWFVVMVEVMIVVVGIFIGLQVDDWNNERKESNEERELLGRLLVDIDKNVQLALMRQGFFDVVQQDSKLVLNYLRSPETVQVEPARLLTAIYNSSHVSPGTFDTTTFEEMSSNGKLGIIKNVALRDAMTSYYHSVTGWSRFWDLDRSGPLRGSVRRIIPYETQFDIVKFCEVIEGKYVNTLMSDCTIEVNEEVSRALISNFSTEPLIAENLNYRISRNQLITVLINLYLASSLELKSSLEEELAQ
jgi:hypothetical protein